MLSQHYARQLKEGETKTRLCEERSAPASESGIFFSDNKKTDTICSKKKTKKEKKEEGCTGVSETL
jgi:hypothetical protein